MNTGLKIFSVHEARALIPWLVEITGSTLHHLARKNLPDPVLPEEGNLADCPELGQIIHHWAETVAKLGAIPKQPFTVDFDTGRDLLCWAYPEDLLLYRHGYDDGYMGRYRIKEQQ